MERWVGKTAVVTGASAGIGAAIAVSLANAGLNVVGLDLGGKEQVFEDLKSKVIPGTGSLIGKKCDISSRQEIKTVFSAISQISSGIHVLVNNAGYIRKGTLTEVLDKAAAVSDDDIEGIVNTNLLGLVTCCREAVKYMKETFKQGHIINISSTSGHYVSAALGRPSLNIYYGTKHAVRATSEAMRLEFSHTKTNIKITCISPAVVATNIFKAGGLGKDLRVNVPSLNPEDIAYAVLAVLSTPLHVNIADIIIRPMGDIL